MSEHNSDNSIKTDSFDKYVVELSKTKPTLELWFAEFRQLSIKHDLLWLSAEDTAEEYTDWFLSGITPSEALNELITEAKASE